MNRSVNIAFALTVFSMLAFGAPAYAKPTLEELQGQVDALQKTIKEIQAEQKRAADTKPASIPLNVAAPVADKSEGSKKFKFYGDFQSRFDAIHAKFPEQNSLWKLNQNFDAVLSNMQSTFQSMAISALQAQGQPATLDNVQAMAGQLMQGMPAEQLQQMLGQSMHMNKQDVSNNNLMTNRVRLNMEAKAAEDVEFKGRLNMYKIWGMESSEALSGGGLLYPMKSDDFLFDAGPGHVPSDNVARIDRAYANWNEPFGTSTWFSIGRRPTTGGPPAQLRQGLDFWDLQATPVSLAIDYAFDGLTYGIFLKDDWYPFEGGKFRFCYGKGFEGGFRHLEGQASLDDALFYGGSWDVIANHEQNLFVNLQSFRAQDLPDSLNVGTATATLGDIQSTALVVMNSFDNFEWFASAGWTHASPDGYTNSMASMLDAQTLGFMQSKGINMEVGMLTNPGEELKDHDGVGVWTGFRVPVVDGLKWGTEYNYGSKYWVSFAPSVDDDPWTAKAATRGHVLDTYFIYNLPVTLLDEESKAFFRFGYQYYHFDYTNSGSYLGAPIKVSDLGKPGVTTLMPSPEDVNQWYASFNVFF